MFLMFFFIVLNLYYNCLLLEILFYIICICRFGEIEDKLGFCFFCNMLINVNKIYLKFVIY